MSNGAKRTGDTRPNRVTITIEKKVTGEKAKELPYKPIILAKLSGVRSDKEVRERERITINDRNFDDVMRKIDVKLEGLSVKSHLPDSGAELYLKELEFDSIKSFHPDELVKKVPELNRLVELRSLLNDFMSRVSVNKKFQTELDHIVRNSGDYKQLLESLKKVVANGTNGLPAKA